MFEGSTLKPRSVYILSTGQIITSGTESTCRGSFSWDVSWVSLEPSSIPGYPPEYELGVDT